MYNNLPKHIWWEVNGKPYANFKSFLEKNIKLDSFDYKILSDAPITSSSFRQECLNAAKLLPDTHLAIPVSGSDSEIIARCARALDRKVTIYYEDYPWADPSYKSKSQALAKELQYEWVGLKADYDSCLERMKYYSVALGNMSRGFLISLGMFDNIPKDQFIVGGIGDLEKDGWIYRKTLENFIGNNWEEDIVIPSPPTEIIWWLYGEQLERHGMWSFFNSTLPLIKSQATHPLLSYGKHNKGVCNTIAMKNAEWPELIFKAKTDHFHPTDEFYLEIYYDMEKNMYNYYPQELFSLVKNGFCGFVNYTKLFDNL